MDNNKLKKLNDINYHIIKCCGTCDKSAFPTLSSNFGTCYVHKYKHEKHGTERDMSICRFGVCSSGQYEVKYDSEIDLFEKYLNTKRK